MTIPLSKEERASPKRNPHVGAIDDARAAIVGFDRVGESAPARVLSEHFGFTVKPVDSAVKRVIAP